MKTRAVLAVVAVAGLAAAANAQESFVYSLTFTEVNAGTSVAVSAPNGTIDTGEAARVALKITMTPGIGATVTYTPPPAPGTGTLAGLGSVFFDIGQTNALGGTWNLITRNAGGADINGTPNNWTLGGAGVGNAAGGIDAAQAGQFVLPGSTANVSNPIVNIWRATWTPSTYTNRTVTFQSAAAVAAGPNHSSILVQYGLDPNTGDPLYVAKYISAQFGNVQIPVAPAPASLALLGLGGLVAGRRRR